jgi:hypothetical protein
LPGREVGMGRQELTRFQSGLVHTPELRQRGRKYALRCQPMCCLMPQRFHSILVLSGGILD